MTNLRNRMSSRNRKQENAPLWTSKAARLRWKQGQARQKRTEARRIEVLHRAANARLLCLLVSRVPEQMAAALREYLPTVHPEKARALLLLMASLNSGLHRFRKDGLTWPQVQHFLETRQTDSALVIRAMEHGARGARLAERLVIQGCQQRGEI